jgi:hypothetical protein
LPESAEAQVTLTLQNVRAALKPGVLDFLAEMSELFCVHLYTMGSREYVHQALHHVDIFKPGHPPTQHTHHTHHTPNTPTRTQTRVHTKLCTDRINHTLRQATLHNMRWEVFNLMKGTTTSLCDIFTFLTASSIAFSDNPMVLLGTSQFFHTPQKNLGNK